jgi:hypothetical protein
MFEKTREVTRKDRYGFPDEEFPHRVVMTGSTQSGISRRELALMSGCEPILAGDIQNNPGYDHDLPPSQENSLFTVTVTAELLGGTRNLVCDGQALSLVHGERKYRLNDEGLVRKRAAQLEIKVKDLAKAFEALEQHILQAVAEVGTQGADQSPPAVRH